MSLLFNMLSRLVIAFLPRSKCLNFMAVVTICSDFGAQENKTCHRFHFCYCSVTQLCPSLWDFMDCSTPSFPILHHLPEFVQMHVHWVSDTILLYYPLSPSSQSLPASGSFPICRLFTSGGLSIGASALASVPPMNIQGWFPLGLTALISLQSKGLRVSSVR